MNCNMRCQIEELTKEWQYRGKRIEDLGATIRAQAEGYDALENENRMLRAANAKLIMDNYMLTAAHNSLDRQLAARAKEGDRQAITLDVMEQNHRNTVKLMLDRQKEADDLKNDVRKLNQLLAERSKELEAAKRVLRESGCTALTEELEQVRAANADFVKRLDALTIQRDTEKKRRILLETRIAEFAKCV